MHRGRIRNIYITGIARKQLRNGRNNHAEFVIGAVGISQVNRVEIVVIHFDGIGIGEIELFDVLRHISALYLVENRFEIIQRSVSSLGQRQRFVDEHRSGLQPVNLDERLFFAFSGLAKHLAVMVERPELGSHFDKAYGLALSHMDNHAVRQIYCYGNFFNIRKLGKNAGNR